MAPTISYTAIPASLWASDSPFLDLTARGQWLYIRLWTWEARNAAGFVPWQPSLWIKSSKSATEQTVALAVEELCEAGRLLVDYDAEVAWLAGFIREDTYNSPNQYVAVMKLIRTCPSWMLRDAAWKEVQRLGLPPVKSDGEAGKKMAQRMQRAFDELQTRMISNPGGGRNLKGFPNGSETPSKLSNAHAHAHGHEDDDADRCSTSGCPNVPGPEGFCGACVAAGKW
ncbi:hypothetical protein ACTXG7_11540 [Mycolicibacterium sp. Dal123E01]|uniref:hypothetical protein n=1 Tax=Mycolicibacterium sp. Dal123E01 TaxID=3457578 RepID=UPI00403E6887